MNTPHPRGDSPAPTADHLRAENADLRWRLEEAEETLRAIRSGAVDAVVVGGADGRRVYTLDGADRAYRLWVEQINQGAATLTADGNVLYSNPRLAALLATPPERLAARPLREFVRPADRPRYDALLLAGRTVAAQGELSLAAADGTPVPVLLSLTPLPPDSGAAVGVLATDLTAQRHHEELSAAHTALRVSEERLGFALTAGRMGTWDLDLRTGVMTCSDACKRNYGRGPGEPFGYADLAASVHEDDRERWRQVVADAVARATDFAVEYRTVWPDGSVKWVHVRASCQTADDGSVAALSGVSFDVTDRKRAEEGLRTSEGRFRTLFDSMDQGFCVIEVTFASDRPTDYRFSEMNPAFERHTGLRGVLGRSVREAVPGLEEFWFDTYGRVAATGEPVRFTHQAAPLDARWFDVYAFRLQDADRHRVAILFTDISDRKRSEEQLRASEERYRLLFDSIDEGFCVIEFLDGPHGPLSDYVHVQANPAYATNTGIPNIVGQKVREMVPDEAAAWVDTYRRVLLTGEPVRFERELVATKRHLELSAFRMGPPELRQVAVLFKDVTARKRAEEELRDADRRKDEFLALLAHELRNPLAPLRNGLQVMRLASGDADALTRAREMMDRQLAHMVRLIDDLLDVSRINRNKMELRRTRLTLADVVGTAVETVRPAVDAAGHELTVRLPDQPIHLHADLTRLAQVVGNLLTNSAKYTLPGGRIWLTAEAAGGEAVVTVRDTGVGIPAHALPTIFDMFSQVDRSIEKSTGGLGIGLALVKGLVEMHGGTVTADSGGEGAGSVFTVRLPAVAADAAADAPPEDAPAEADRHARRVLVVDDNHDGAESLAMMLSLLGDRVAVAHDGLEAVEAAERERPDVILMDVGMPRLNGLDATRRIRERPWGVAPLIIALTGWGQDGDRARSREAGCDAHLVKPVELAELERLLATFASRPGVA